MRRSPEGLRHLAAHLARTVAEEAEAAVNELLGLPDSADRIAAYRSVEGDLRAFATDIWLTTAQGKAEEAADEPFKGVAERMRWQLLSQVEPFIGLRVRLRRDVGRYPHFNAMAGRTGTVDAIEEDSLTVRMDEPLPGAEEWDNCIQWFDQTVLPDGSLLHFTAEFWQDCEAI